MDPAAAPIAADRSNSQTVSQAMSQSTDRIEEPFDAAGALRDATKRNREAGLGRYGAVIDLTTDHRPAVMHREVKPESMMESGVAMASLDLPETVQRALDDLGFTQCTPIQAETLPYALKGRDIAGQAQTGTGKTAAFLIAIFKELLESERTHPSAPRAVVVAPTRELAVQIAEDGDSIGRYTDLNIVSVFGGMDWDKQARELEVPVDVLVGTPGRMMDYMKRGLIDLRYVQVVVIDEADRMFDMGFVQDIRFILSRCNEDRQTLLFSATFTFEVMRLARRFTRDAWEIRIEPGQVTAASVEQKVYHVGEREKLRLLLWALAEFKPHRALLFVNTKRTGDYLLYKLSHNAQKVGYISGDISQVKRMKLLDEFKSGELTLLVATDVAARGLHIEDIDLVVNYDTPNDAEDYVHRIGRTGRAGAKGVAITLADERLVENLPAIERYIGHRIPHEFPGDEMFVPDRAPSYRQHSAENRSDRPGGRPRSGGGGGGGGRGGPRGGGGRRR